MRLQTLRFYGSALCESRITCWTRSLQPTEWARCGHPHSYAYGNNYAGQVKGTPHGVEHRAPGALRREGIDIIQNDE